MKVVQSIESMIVNISKVLNIIAIVVLGMLTCLTTADVMGRALFDAPITGSVEISNYMMVCIGFMGLAWCAAAGRHVSVTLLTDRLSPRVQAVLKSIMLLGTFCVLVIMTWRGFVESLAIRDSHVQSMLLHIPKYPFYWIMVLSLIVLCLVVVVQFVQSVIKAAKK